MISTERVAVRVRKCIRSEYYPGCLTEKLQYCLFVKQLEKLDDAIRNNREMIGRDYSYLLLCYLVKSGQ